MITFLGMGLTCGIWPLGFLLRAFKGATLILEPSQRRLRRLSRALVLIFIALTTVFVAGLIGTTLYVAFDNEVMLLLSLLPVWSRPLFFIPPLLALLAGAIAIAALQIWRTDLGGLPSRLYYSALALCAVGYTVTLATGGMLMALF